ncbi:hypothetical protein S40293_10167 [Stachybotrys chartarum IBT 40293]|nr:hypothetical protein S40293_10167 [Stachybotrys chartarum IBT 40293]
MATDLETLQCLKNWIGHGAVRLGPATWLEQPQQGGDGDA